MEKQKAQSMPSPGGNTPRGYWRPFGKYQSLFETHLKGRRHAEKNPHHLGDPLSRSASMPWNVFIYGMVMTNHDKCSQPERLSACRACVLKLFLKIRSSSPILHLHVLILKTPPAVKLLSMIPFHRIHSLVNSYKPYIIIRTDRIFFLQKYQDFLSQHFTISLLNYLYSKFPPF